LREHGLFLQTIFQAHAAYPGAASQALPLDARIDAGQSRIAVLLERLWNRRL
jgi:hypothetical protein